VFAPVKEAAEEEYYSFKDAIVLCMRCHYAKEKGWVLCEICRKKFHKPMYEQCWECYKKIEEGQGTKQYELPYVHPWCGKTFLINREWWEIAAVPEQCCISVCDTNPNLCETANKHWK